MALLELPLQQDAEKDNIRGSRILLVPSADIAPVDRLMYRDGRPTNTLRRLQAAHRLWKTGKFDFIIVSGGRTHRKSIETKPAAHLMAVYFTGITTRNRMIIEDESLDSYQNAQFSWQRLLEANFTDPKITVVSQWQHTIRFWLTFRALGAKIKRYPLHYPMTPKQLLMEFGFIALHLIDPLGQGWFARKNRLKREMQTMGIS